MPYPEIMIHGMRAELANLGIEETKTPEAVKEAVENTDGTLMVVVNSVCGCAAGGVRPGIAMALQHAEAKPDKAITVFAGADIDATDVAHRALANHVVLAPGNAFSVSQTASSFLRFNVAQCEDERIFKVLRAAMRP